jgi:16S rRNA (adenine1518-N6/adenine1519-N6)-dimethyltransferase
MPSDHNHRPAKKSLGQHFLVNQGAIDSIADSFDLKNKTVIEIGPGRGAITNKLKDCCDQLILVEMDDDLFSHWEGTLKEPSCCIHGDAAVMSTLEKALSKSNSEKVIVISNLPYNASTAILMNLIKLRDSIEGMTLMFQKEVGERIASSEGSKQYSSLSILSQNWFSIDTALKLKPGSFNPPPKVHSIVLKFTPLDEPIVPIEGQQFDTFERFVRGCFMHRRKTIKKSLQYALPSLKDVDVIFEQAGVSTGNRAESLPIEDFGKLFHLFYG